LVNVQLESPRILVKGFLIDVDVPSEERLMMHVDISALPGYKHVDWVSSLQDLLRRIDSEFRAERFGDGGTVASKRSVRVKYVKGEDGAQRKVAAFHPYPSTLVNRLKTIRHEVYALLNKYCLVLQEEKIGRARRKLYFLPAGLAADLMASIEEVNEKMRILAKEVAEFEGSVWFNEIMERVSEAIEIEGGFKAEVSPVRVSPVPLTLSRQFFAEYLAEEEKKALAEVEERRRAGLAALEREVEQRRREMLESLERDLKARIASIMDAAQKAVEMILKGERASVQALARQLGDLKRLVEGVGVEFGEQLAALGSVLSHAASKDIKGLKAAVSELAESVGIVPSGSLEVDLKAASLAMQGKSLLLTTID